jgi:2-phospho-L-lactate transferase/gluconeogenesis factor (CofD/UPF0052 family)
MSSSRVTAPLPGRRDLDVKVKVVVFSGGRGSRGLSGELVSDPRVELTLAVNGYDDGLSTGEIRKLLGDCLGPSDFRKNAAHMAAALHTCEAPLLELLELRLPEGIDAAYGRACLGILTGGGSPGLDSFHNRLQSLMEQISRAAAEGVSRRAELFARAVAARGGAFHYADCSIGNIVFAGCYLDVSRNFNAAISAYCKLAALPDGILQNVTDGTNAFLVAVDAHGCILASEADIVDANRRNRIEDIYLIDHPISTDEACRLNAASRDEVRRFLEACGLQPGPNEALLGCIREADLIVYAPGTQHSSLFPSYLTPGVGDAIAGNLHAAKLLITNLHQDADIAGASAVTIIERAVYYLREKDRRATPVPCLITHYLINDPSPRAEAEPHVPLGSVESLDDPRLVRIADYEDGVSGRHHAGKVLQPYIDSFVKRAERRRIAVLLLASDSLNKISQSMIEMVRGGVEELPFDVEVFYQSRESFDRGFADTLPFRIRNLGGTAAEALFTVLGSEAFDYVVLFESSGMYQGGDIVNLIQHLKLDRVDAIWGSRRLSINDIHMAYRLLHRRTPVRGAISYIGSHVLSLTCLLLYGRYISDTLSGARAIRTSYLRENGLDPWAPGVNFRILAALLRDRAEVFETPVHYFPISPEKVRRTTVHEGLSAVFTLFISRFKRLRYHRTTRTIMPHSTLGTLPGPDAARSAER